MWQTTREYYTLLNCFFFNFIPFITAITVKYIFKEKKRNTEQNGNLNV